MLSNCGAERTPESPLDSKEIKPVNLKGDRPWILIGRTHAKAEVQYSDNLMRTGNSVKENPDAGKDWRQKEKRATEGETAGWHHRWSWPELGQTPGRDEGQEGLACYSSWGCGESDTMGWLNNGNSTIGNVFYCFIDIKRKRPFPRSTSLLKESELTWGSKYWDEQLNVPLRELSTMTMLFICTVCFRNH